MTRHLALFGKPPIPGRVKTRLSPPLSAEQSAELYAAFLADICARNRPSIELTTLFVEPPFDRASLRETPISSIRVAPQRGAGLIDRMIAAFEDGFGSEVAHGTTRRDDAAPIEPNGVWMVLRNTDSPLLSTDRELEAFRSLEQGAEIVLGPDDGGGYYLVGLSRPTPDLFRALPMSVPTNFERTLARARELSDRVEQLPREPDIDDIDDLRRLARTFAESPHARQFAPRSAAAVRSLVQQGAIEIASGPTDSTRTRPNEGNPRERLTR